MNLKEKRVLIFSTAYLPLIGGAELAVKEITDRINDIKFDLITAKIKKNLSVHEKIGNINVYRVGLGNQFFDKILLPILGLIKAINLHKRKGYDFIHGLMASQGGSAAYLFKFFYPRIPLILTLQEGDLNRNSFFDRFWQKRIIQKADVIIAISRYLADFAEKFNKKATIHLIPNGVDLEKFSEKLNYSESTELRDKLNIKPDEKVIITVSRLVPKNNIENLLRAFSYLKDFNNGRIKLLIAGSGFLEEKLKKLADELGIITKVIFYGEVPNDELPKYLKISDIFCRPSISEGLGTAFLEAMAAGIPVIATPVGGITDFLKDKETGLFVKASDFQGMADKIQTFLNDKELKEQLIKNARKLVEDKYEWSKISNMIRKIYNGKS